MNGLTRINGRLPPPARAGARALGSGAPRLLLSIYDMSLYRKIPDLYRKKGGPI